MVVQAIYCYKEALECSASSAALPIWRNETTTPLCSQGHATITASTKATTKTASSNLLCQKRDARTIRHICIEAQKPELGSRPENLGDVVKLVLGQAVLPGLLLGLVLEFAKHYGPSLLIRDFLGHS